MLHLPALWYFDTMQRTPYDLIELILSICVNLVMKFIIKQVSIKKE